MHMSAPEHTHSYTCIYTHYKHTQNETENPKPYQNNEPEDLLMLVSYEDRPGAVAGFTHYIMAKLVPYICSVLLTFKVHLYKLSNFIILPIIPSLAHTACKLHLQSSADGTKKQ